MKLFIDTADINEIHEADSMGVLDGVTTNPSLVSKTGRDFKSVARDIVIFMKDRPVSLETISLDASGMIAEGKKLSDFGPNAVVKVPSTVEGLKACKALSSQGMKVNCTICFLPNQA